MSSSKTSHNSMTFEALDVVHNQLKIKLEESNENLQLHIANIMIERKSTNEMGEGIDNPTNIEALQESADLVMEMNSLLLETELEGNSYSTSNPLHRSIEKMAPTGIEALSIVLGNETNDALVQTLGLMRMENYTLTELLRNLLLAYEIDELTDEYEYEWKPPEEDPFVAVCTCRLSSLMRSTEGEIGQASESSNHLVNLWLVRGWNKIMRQNLIEYDVNVIIESEDDDNSMVDDCLHGLTNLQLQARLTSLDSLSQDARDVIPAPLLKAENKFLTEKTKGRILHFKMKWLREAGRIWGVPVPPRMA